MPTITCRIAPTLHERVLAECEARDVKLSDLLREFLERWVDHLDDAKFSSRPAGGGMAVVKTAPGQPKPIGFEMDGSPIYPRTGSLQRPEKGAKK